MLLMCFTSCDIAHDNSRRCSNSDLSICGSSAPTNACRKTATDAQTQLLFDVVAMTLLLLLLLLLHVLPS
jgi:hypothetical protein